MNLEASSALTGAATGSEEGWDPDLTSTLLELVQSLSLHGRALDKWLGGLEEEHGPQVYSQLIHLLCHLHFEPEEAKEHWEKLIAHRALLERRWGSPVDLRVALISYFIQVHRQLENPTIIEMRLFEQTRAYAYRDELTGLRNFRFFEQYLFQEILRSDQYAQPVSLVMVDLDDFKAYNDHLGHAAGNEVLARVGSLLSAACRKVDVPARYGGEEFAIILPSTPKVGARLIAERCRDAIESAMFPGAVGGLSEHLTASIGIATYPADGANAEELVRRADQAMYLAKASGKNQVQLYGKSQRSHNRVVVRLDGRIVLVDREPVDLTTVDLSEGGVRFTSELDAPIGALLDLRLQLPDEGPELVTAGRVVQTIEVAGGGRGTAVRIVDISTRDRRALVGFLSSLPSAPPRD